MTTSSFRPALAAAMLVIGTIGLGACEGTAEQDRAAIEQEILGAPGTEKLWGTIKREYPQDFAVLVDRVQALDFADRRDPAKKIEIGRVWQREFFERIGPDAVKAPAEEMLAWSAAEAELYGTLQRSSLENCAAMTMGGWIYVENDPIAVGALAKRNAAMVQAAAAGRDDPQTYAEPVNADFVELGFAIESTGIAPELQAALGSDDAMAALSPAQQCEVGVAFFEGVTALPDEVEVPIAAYVLAPGP